MQQLVAVGIAALVWAVVCFSCGFLVAMVRRLGSENKLLRSTVSALSCAQVQPQSVPPQQRWAANPQPEQTNEDPPAPPLELLHFPPPQRESVAPSGIQTSVAPQPQPSTPRVYLFGDPHAQQLSQPKHHPLVVRPGSPGWPNQPHPTPRIITMGTDLLPRRVQHGRRRLRGRR
jgi:hypothetical protein